jgi:hypothetical protein
MARGLPILHHLPHRAIAMYHGESKTVRSRAMALRLPPVVAPCMTKGDCCAGWRASRTVVQSQHRASFRQERMRHKAMAGHPAARPSCRLQQLPPCLHIAPWQQRTGSLRTLHRGLDMLSWRGWWWGLTVLSACCCTLSPSPSGASFYFPSVLRCLWNFALAQVTGKSEAALPEHTNSVSVHRNSSRKEEIVNYSGD